MPTFSCRQRIERWKLISKRRATFNSSVEFKVNCTLYWHNYAKKKAIKLNSDRDNWRSVNSNWNSRKKFPLKSKRESLSTLVMWLIAWLRPRAQSLGGVLRSSHAIWKREAGLNAHGLWNSKKSEFLELSGITKILPKLTKIVKVFYEDVEEDWFRQVWKKPSCR